MKSLTLKSMSALALALVAGGVMTTTVSAEDHTKNSEGKVHFNEGKIDIVDPDNPTGPAAPSFDFGKRNVENGQKTYNAETAGSLIISDLRGSGAGWRVRVTQTEQLKTVDAAKKELQGAQLKLNKADTYNSNNETVTFTAATLTPGVQSADIFKAEKDNGNGISKLTFKDNTDDATLTVVDASKVKSGVDYTAELVWTLTDSPA